VKLGALLIDFQRLSTWPARTQLTPAKGPKKRERAHGVYLREQRGGRERVNTAHAQTHTHTVSGLLLSTLRTLSTAQLKAI